MTHHRTASPAEWVAAHAGSLHELSLVRERPWGRIYRYGELWLKINGGGTTYEPAVLDLLKGRPLTPHRRRNRTIARLQQSFTASAEVALVAGIPDHPSQLLPAGLRRLEELLPPAP